MTYARPNVSLLLPGLALALCACGGTVATTTEDTSPSTTTVTTGGPSTSSSTTAPTSSTTPTSSTSTGTSDTTGCEFACEPDTPPDPFGCDLFLQNCPEGQKCSPFDTHGNGNYPDTKCVDVGGDDQHDDPCVRDPESGIGTCAKGSFCWNLDANNGGTCVAHCIGSYEDPSCAPACHECLIGAEGITLCIAGCDPLAQDCDGNKFCIEDPMGDGFVCLLDASGGEGTLGTSCEFANVCNEGLVCADYGSFPHPDCDPESIGCCATFCDTTEGVGDQNPTCQALAGDVPGVECVPLIPDPDECTPTAGVCSIPQP